jgi:dihydrofolate synthase/folylpolyglutamate synthase
LGDTIEAIAAEKAGIIKPGCPVVMGQMHPKARQVIEAIAQQQQAPIHSAEDEIRVTVSRRTVHGQTLQCSSPACDYPAALTRLAGSYQAVNAATALCALECLGERGLPIPPKAFAEALRTVEWKGRCQLLSNDPPTFLDGGHNPDALKALCDSLKSMHIRRRVALVCGFCGDKAVSEALRELTAITSVTWTVPIANERSLSPEDTAAAATQAGMTQVIPMTSVAEAIEAATTWAQDNQGTVLICGSLYLVGEVLALQGEGEMLDPGEAHRAH